VKVQMTAGYRLRCSRSIKPWLYSSQL